MGPTGRGALFPQVVSIVQAYIRERVDFNGAHPCEIGLQTYAQRIVGILVAAIRPDDDQGEPPLLPRPEPLRADGQHVAGSLQDGASCTGNHGEPSELRGV